MGTQPDQPLSIDALTRRYAGATPEALMAVLCPLLIPVVTIDKTIKKWPGQSHYRATFTAAITPESASVLQRGRTGKFVPAAYVQGTGPWREICKGRVIDVDWEGKVVTGDRKSVV